MKKQQLHPAAAFFLRGFGNVLQKAVNRAAESVLEDVENAADGVGGRARSVRARIKCICRCPNCSMAKKNRSLDPNDHCDRCGFAVMKERKT